MTAMSALKELSQAWTQEWVRLLNDTDRDIYKTPKGAAKALVQLETAAFFMTVAQMVTKSKLPVDRKEIVEGWIEGELQPYGKTLNDLRNNASAYTNTTKRVTKMVDTQIGHLKTYGLVKKNAGNTYALTQRGQEVFKNLGG
ncbi:hypothetical protein [Agrobacterium sp. 10MFCol1.1]|uniref:hypothetical protein n=1 Tax=Agrobacterium sp. 10MFCol1.1 TaxID=1150775 RepID=UPI000378E629|nr:hypothetical protein [Agrobacterium sp. 10MFCol1.1]